MKKTIVAALLVIVFLAGCGNKKPKSNVTLMDMTKYEHSVTAVPDSGKKEPTAVKDTDGYTVVSDKVYVTSNTLNIILVLTVCFILIWEKPAGQRFL